MRKKNLILIFFTILPKSLISRAIGCLARVHMPGVLLGLIISFYCNKYKVKQDEIDYPDHGFRTIDEFFTRKLKAGVHKINTGKNSIVSPADSRIDQFGTIKKGSIIQAKGMEFSLEDLIPCEMSGEFINGSFITLYLSPADYHRIHSPVDGKITGYFSIPGKLFPVQENMVTGRKGLFTKNERILTYIKNKNGLHAVCKIGAMNVGRITLTYSKVEANKFKGKRKQFFYAQGDEPSIRRGEEIGIFHLGSTIILIFQKNTIRFEKIERGQRVRMGQKIAGYI